MSTTPTRPPPGESTPASPPRRSWLDRVRGPFGSDKQDGTPGYTVNASRALALVHDGATLLDVRTRAEWKDGHAPQAIHVPLADIDSAPRRLKQCVTVVVMCASGARSRSAAARLRALGYTATSLSGGIGAWRAAGGPTR